MGFLWLFHKSPKKATEFNTSLHVLMPSGFDETIECKPQKTKVMKQGTVDTNWKVRCILIEKSSIHNLLQNYYKFKIFIYLVSFFVFP